MQKAPLAKLLISEVTGIVIYLIPALLWFFDDLSGAMLMFLYMIESVITVGLAIITVLLLAPKSEYPKNGNYGKKIDLIKNFILISSGFVAICLMFLSAFVFLVLKVRLDLNEIAFALMIIAGFQLFEFFSNLFLMRPLTLKKAEFFLSESLGGVVVIILSIIVGVFLAIWVEEWFVLPFLILHALIVIGSPIQYFWKGKVS